MDACDRFLLDLELAVEDPDYPIPLPCDNDDCEGEQMIYTDGHYVCPLCGRMVNEEDIDEYLENAL